MNEKIELDVVDKFTFLQNIGFDGSWKFSQDKCISLLNVFTDMLNMQTKMTPLKIMIYEDKGYTRDECIVLLREFAGMLNEQCAEAPINVVVYEDKNEKAHKLDIQTVVDGIKTKREQNLDGLEDDEIKAIKDLYKDGYSKSAIAKALDTSRVTVNKYCK